MKSTHFGFAVGLTCLTLAACGSDKAATGADTGTVKAACTPVTDADLVAAKYSDAALPACSSQMYAKYKDAGFQAVNAGIGKLALSAPTDKLGTSFQDKIAKATPARQTEFVGHLLRFLESAYGSSTAYTGPDMTTAHKGLDITIAQYNYFITGVVVPALTTAGVDPNDISGCFAPAVLNKSFVKSVVTCK